MEKKFFGYKAVLGAFLIMFITLGTATTLGVFLASLSADSGFPVTTVAYIGTSCTISCVIFSLVASKLLAKGTPLRTMVLIGLLANALGMLCYTFAIPNNVISLVFFYLGGFLIGIALTFSAHAVCGAIIASWFIEDREKLMGMVFSGAGFGFSFLSAEFFISRRAVCVCEKPEIIGAGGISCSGSSWSDKISSRRSRFDDPL